MRISIKNFIKYVKDKLTLRKTESLKVKENTERLDRLVQETIKRGLELKRNSCDALISQIEQITYLTIHDDKEMKDEQIPIPDGLKEQVIEELIQFRNSDSLRHTLYVEEYGEDVVTDYLDVDSNGVNYGTDMYNIGIDGHYRKHYYSPNEILYRFYLLNEAKKVQKK